MNYRLAISFIALAVGSVLLSGCKGDNDDGPGRINIESGLTFGTRSVSPQLLANTRVFMFDGDNSYGAEGRFRREVVSITRTDDKLGMKIEVGLWDFMLVGCDDPLSGLVNPVRNDDPENLLMWKTAPVGGLLPNTPEIRTATLEGIDIVADVTHDEYADLTRHVAKVCVTLKDGIGFGAGGGHFVYLKDVPTSLSWGGTYHPNRDNPEVSAFPMKGELNFINNGDGTQKSIDTVSFIIPAHKTKRDASGAIIDPINDKSTHRLTLAGEFVTVGGTSFTAETELQHLPCDNQILMVSITAKAGIQVETQILDWNVESGTANPKLYEAGAISYDMTDQVWTMPFTMFQERNWWMTLSDGSYEFVSSALGEKGDYEIKIRQSSSHPGGSPPPTMLRLHISGVPDVVAQWAVQ